MTEDEIIQRYLAWRQAVLDIAGQELAAKMPTMYGNVQFNLQGGKCVNVNVNDTVRLNDGGKNAVKT